MSYANSATSCSHLEDCLSHYVDAESKDKKLKSIIKEHDSSYWSLMVIKDNWFIYVSYRIGFPFDA